MHATLVCAALLLGPAPANRPDVVAKAGDKATLNVEKEVGDLSGYYSCSGSEGIGKSYKGVATITKKGDIYVVQWMVGTGSAFYGVGIQQGNNLACSWAIPGDKGIVRGVNLYRIEPGPRLVGRWAAIPGDGSMRSETLTFLKKMEDE